MVSPEAIPTVVSEEYPRVVLPATGDYHDQATLYFSLKQFCLADVWRQIFVRDSPHNAVALLAILAVCPHRALSREHQVYVPRRLYSIFPGRSSVMTPARRRVGQSGRGVGTTADNGT